MKRRLLNILLATMVLASVFLILLTAASYVRTLGVDYLGWSAPAIVTDKGVVYMHNGSVAVVSGWLVSLWSGNQAIGSSQSPPAGPIVFHSPSEIREYRWFMRGRGSVRRFEQNFLIFDYSNTGWILGGHLNAAYPNLQYRTADFRLRISLWAIILPVVTATVWLWVLRRRRRHRDFRRTNHLCESCGYDLRFTPDRCPECGQSRF